MQTTPRLIPCAIIFPPRPLPSVLPGLWEPDGHGLVLAWRDGWDGGMLWLCLLGLAGLETLSSVTQDPPWCWSRVCVNIQTCTSQLHLPVMALGRCSPPSVWGLN